MGHEEGYLILAAGGLLALGLAASLAAGRLHVPGLVLFLGVGMLLGSEGPGNIGFTNYELARTIGVIALALILFEGGLAAGFPTGTLAVYDVPMSWEDLAPGALSVRHVHTARA